MLYDDLAFFVGSGFFGVDFFNSKYKLVEIAGGVTGQIFLLGDRQCTTTPVSISPKPIPAILPLGDWGNYPRSLLSNGA